MANEAVILAGLTIINDPVDYRSEPNQFRGDVTGKFGPAPGAFSVTTEGVDVDLSMFTTPGYCIIRNLDATNFFTIGAWDGIEFIPLFEVLPGEHYVMRLSRQVGNAYGTGTGVTDTGNTLRFKADTAAVNAVVEGFES